MSGPKRELPPLTIKITGDSNHALSHIQQVIKELGVLKNLQKQMAAGTVGNAAASVKQIKQAVNNATTACLSAVANNVNKAAKKATSIWFVSSATLRSAVRGAIKAINAAITNIVQSQAKALANVKIGGQRSLVRTLRTLVAEIIRAATTVSAASMRQTIASMGNRPILQGYIRRQFRRVIMDAINAIVAIIRASILLGIANMSTRGFSRALGSAISAAIRNALRNYRFTNNYRPPGGLGGGGGGGGMGGGMMGARADIFMHQATLQSMGAGLLSLIKPFAQVENYEVQMKAFAGSADEAKKAVAELQAYAIKSPYSLEGVLNASTTMMKYGAETQHAVEMTKLLGDVSAGNTHKLELMSLAVGQAEALGRFQGQELRQMVNAGFNPLAIAAKELAGPGADKAAIQKQMKLLQENMRAGALDSGIIEAALRIATSKGGDFAGLADEQASTLTGLASQIIETLDLVSIEIVKVFAGDLSKLLKEVKRYLDAVVAWTKANKGLVVTYVKLGMRILETVALFSALALTIAYVTWIWGTLRGVAMVFMFLLTPLTRGVILLGQAFLYLGRTGIVAAIQAAIAWLAATAPIWGIPVAIAAAVAAFAAITVVVEGFSRKGGFASVFYDGIKAGMAFLGFMYNLEHNLKAIFEGVEKNQGALTYDTLITNNPNMQLLRTAAKAVGAGGAFGEMEAGTRKGITGKGSTGTAGYNTSMFKFDLPKVDTKSVLGSMDSMLGVSDALKPYLKPLEGAPEIPDKPNIDFNQFLGKGGKGKGGNVKPIEHAMRGSADHALRMYEYGERVSPAAADPKQQHQKKVEDLLGEIAKNTRSSAPMGPTMIEEAALV
jgi:hypothetical protein